MLHLAGMKVQDIFETLEAQRPPQTTPSRPQCECWTNTLSTNQTSLSSCTLFGSLCKETRKQWRSLQHGWRSKPNFVDLGMPTSRSEMSWWKEFAVTSCGRSSWTSKHFLCRKPWRLFVDLRPRRQCRDVCPPHQPPQDSKATRCVVWVHRNSRSDNERQPGRSRRSLAPDVDNRATTSRFRHVQRESTFAVDVDSRGITTSFVGADGRKENPTGARLCQDCDRVADDHHKILWPRAQTMEPWPRTMSGLCTRSHGSNPSVACRTGSRGSGTLRHWQCAWTSMERIWTWSRILAQWCH